MRITLIISKMSNSGGTERVMSILSGELVKRNHNVTIITVSDKSDKSFYPLNPEIQLIKTNILGKIKNPFLKLLFSPLAVLKIRKAILNTKPDMVISYVDVLNIMTILSLSGTNIPVIATEHFSPVIRKIGNIWEYLRIKTYKHTKAITVMTPEDKNYFPLHLQNKISVLPNPAVKSDIIKSDHADLKYELIAVGRLVKDKGFDILINAFSIIEKDFPRLELNIYGSGVEYNSLCDQIDSLNLENRIFIHEPVNDIIHKMISSDVMILSSRQESFGMVIVEAMAAGVPVIAADCPNGPRNIISDGVNGILVKNENPEEMSKKIIMLLKDSEMRKKIGINALKITDELSLEKFMAKWEDIIGD